MTATPLFILASGSPRRRDLLREAGYHFEVIPSQSPEPKIADKDCPPEEVARRLAEFKARDVANRESRPAVVLGADTIVACNGQILGKGRDEADARSMLHLLSRTRHRVITGVALIDTQTGETTVDSATSWITMRPMTEREIDDYIASGAWKDKAGSYAVQEGADKFITHIDGSFTNVVGLPMELVKQMLKTFGIVPLS